MFNRFTANNVESNNKDSLVFTIETTDKNSSIKERHLPYNQLLLKSDTDQKDVNKKMTTAAVGEEQIQRMNNLIKHSVIEMEQKPENDHDFSWVVEPN